MKVSIYIPDSVYSDKLSHAEIVQHVVNVFVGKFGGCTSETNKGYYRRKDNGKIDEEITTVLHTFTDEEGLMYIEDIAMFIRIGGNQESVLVTVDRNITAKFI